MALTASKKQLLTLATALGFLGFVEVNAQTQNCGFGLDAGETPTAKMQIKGSGSTNTTSALKVTSDDINDVLLELKDDGELSLSGKLKMEKNNPLYLSGENTFINADGTLKKMFFNVPNNGVDVDGFQFQTNYGAGQMVFDKNGRLGIGTTSPNFSFEVEGNDPGAVYSGIHNLNPNGEARVFIGTGVIDANGYDKGGYLAYIGSNNEMQLGNGGAPGSRITMKVRPTSGSGIEAMRIESNGNIGIGTTDPDFKLHIEGNSSVEKIYVENTASSNGQAGIDFKLANQHTRLIADDNSVFRVWDQTGGKERMKIRTNGYVGIGANWPTKALHIENNDPIIKMQDMNSDASSLVSYMAWNDQGDNEMGYVGFGSSGNDDLYLSNNYSGGDILFRTNFSEKMRIGSDGKVGIGTTSPGGVLEVYDESSNGTSRDVLKVTRQNSTTNAEVGMNFGLKNDGTSFAGVYAQGTDMTNNDGALNFYTSNAGTLQKQMTIDHNGDLVSTGIVKAGDATGYGAMYVNSGSSNVADIRFQRSGADNFLLRSDVGANDNKFYVIGNNGSEQKLMTFQKDGNVGIGTTSPIYKMHVVANDEYNLTIDNTDASKFSRMRFLKNGGANSKHAEIGFNNLDDKLIIKNNATVAGHIKVQAPGDEIYLESDGLGVGTSLTSVDNSAAIEIKSTTQGFLPPRMTEAQKNAISNPAEGLMIYQTNGTKGWYGYDGTNWVKLN